MFSDTYFVAPSAAQEVEHIQGVIHDTVTTPFVTNLGFVVGGGGDAGSSSASVDPQQVVGIVTSTVTKTFVDSLGVNAATLAGTALSALATIASLVPTITSTVTKSFVDALWVDAATLGGVSVAALATVASLVPTITSTVTKAFVDALGINATTLDGLSSSAFATPASVGSAITSTVTKTYVDALGINAATLGGTALTDLATKTYVTNSLGSLYRPLVYTNANGVTLTSTYFGKFIVWEPTANCSFTVDGSAVSAVTDSIEVEFFNNSVYTITFVATNGASLICRNNGVNLLQLCSAVLKYWRNNAGVYQFVLVGGLSP